MRGLRDRQNMAPVLPQVPGQLMRGYLDTDDNTWVSIARADEQPFEMRMQRSNGEQVVMLDLAGDLLVDTVITSQKTHAVPKELLARQTIGHFITPFGDGVYKNSYTLAKAVNTIAKEALGKNWATVQALELFGRMRDKQRRLTVYAFLYTFRWARLEWPEWKVDVQKVCIHD